MGDESQCELFLKIRIDPRIPASYRLLQLESEISVIGHPANDEHSINGPESNCIA